MKRINSADCGPEYACLHSFTWKGSWPIT